MQKTIIYNQDELSQAINKLAKNILKANKHLSELILIGIITNGYPLAKRIAKIIKQETNIDIPVGKLDISLYRDDLHIKNKFITIQESNIPFSITDKIIILVDDVLFHGRTIRSALNGILDYGRPKKIELAVLLERGYRELPICPNYVSQTVKTKNKDTIKVNLIEITGEDSAILIKE